MHSSAATIVVVDDDEGHRELVRRNLKRSGLTNTVVCLASGAEALDYFFRRAAHAGRPEAELVMLLDINMPGMNGVEVLRQIKQEPHGRQLPIIMLTTTDDPREVKRCYELGCSVYITKPVDPAEFIEAVKRLGMFLTIVRLPEAL